MCEHARIARYFAPLAAGEPGSFGLTDDAALLTPPTGQSLVITTDSVIEAVHVLPGATPQQFAQKLVRRNLSDLAAMGATPWRYTLNLHTPSGMREEWVAAFAATLQAEQQHFDMVLIGGDSTSAAGATIHATMTCFGLVPTALVLKRSGAQVGDDLYVSGTVGDAALGLKMLQQKLPLNAHCVERYHTPTPRLALGLALRGIATAAIDISDGLLADVAQLCTASGVGAMLQQSTIPLSHAAQQIVQHNPASWENVLSGGDDYELCFTAPPEAGVALANLALTLALPITRIGTTTTAQEVKLQDTKGRSVEIFGVGYTHT